MSNEDLYSVYTPAVEPEPVVEAVAVVEEPAPAPVAVEEPVVKSKKSPAPSRQIEGVVSMSALGNKFSHNSLSVALVQEQLIALGFDEAGSDNRGHLSEGTKQALADFCGCSLAEFVLDEKLITKLFKNTAVEVVA
jgi:hypothetical protein